MMRAVIAYAIMAAITFAILLRSFGGRIEAGDKQSIEYPEGAGVGIITACILFVLCVLAAVRGPCCRCSGPQYGYIREE